jgi:AraC-like DNA-binding protein
MDYSFSLPSLIVLVGAVQGLILSFMLATHRRGKQLANRALSVMLFFFSASMMLHTFIHDGLIPSFSFHAEVIQVFFLLINPHLYIYVKVVTDPAITTHQNDLRHAMPLIAGLISLILLYSDAFDGKLIFLLEGLISVLVSFQAIYYVYLSNRILLRYATTVKNTTNPLAKQFLSWLRFLVFGYLVFLFVAFFVEGSGHFAHGLWQYVWLIVSVFIYLIGYRGLKQPEIFSAQLDGLNKSGRKYEKSQMEPARETEYRLRLERVLAEDKPFLDAGLKLGDLAAKTKIPAHYLSQIINKNYGQNFFEFINWHRIEEAKRRIADPGNKHLNISSICYDVGFNSTSAFNAAFKKHTGMTPSKFRNDRPE